MSIMNKIGSAFGIKEEEKHSKNPYASKKYLAKFPPKHPSRSIRRAHNGQLKDQIAKQKRAAHYARKKALLEDARKLNPGLSIRDIVTHPMFKRQVNSSRARPISLGKINYRRSDKRFNPHKAAEIGTVVDPFTGHRFD